VKAPTLDYRREDRDRKGPVRRATDSLLSIVALVIICVVLALAVLVIVRGIP